MGKQVIVPALVFACLLAGCGSGQAEPSEAQAVCDLPIRYEGKIYNGIDNTSESPTRELGVAERAACDDNGPEVGVSFPEKPDHVTAWAYDGVDPDVAIGVRDFSGRFVVLVAEKIPESKAQRIADRLS